MPTESQSQNLPPAGKVTKDNAENNFNSQVPEKASGLVDDLPPSPLLNPNLPIPPKAPAAENKEQVNYSDPGLEKQKNTKIVVFIAAAVLAVLAIYGVLAATVLRKDLKNIKVSGKEVKFSFQGYDVSAQLGQKKTLQFFTNGGGLYEDDSANFMVIPMDKIRYLEDKYSDFTHCNSPGEGEAKSLSFPIQMLASNAEAKKNLKELEDLVSRLNLVVFEIEGSPLQNMQGKNNGQKFTFMSQDGMIFYLVDRVRIIQENYER